MGRALSLSALLVIGCSRVVVAEEIPLKEIWAFDMPDTRDVRELESEAFGEQAKGLPVEQQADLQNQSLIGQIRESLKWKDNAKAERGFALSGTGLDALKTAFEVLTGKSQRSDSLPSDGEVTVVFFSRQSGSHVQIYQVVRNGNIIEVRYRFAPHDDAYQTEHFALIPLGKLPRGLYQVKVVRGPMEDKNTSVGFTEKKDSDASRIVSRSFKFGVK
jgi:hypothetical protein